MTVMHIFVQGVLHCKTWSAITIRPKGPISSLFSTYTMPALPTFAVGVNASSCLIRGNETRDSHCKATLLVCPILTT